MKINVLSNMIMSIPLTKETTSLLQADTQDCFLWIKDLLHLLFTLIAFQIVLKQSKTNLPMSLTDFSSGAAASLSQCSSCRDTSDTDVENIDAKYEK